MFGPAAAYVVAFCMLVFCGLSALALITAVNYLDTPEARDKPDRIRDHVAV